LLNNSSHYQKWLTISLLGTRVLSTQSGASQLHGNFGIIPLIVALKLGEKLCYGLVVVLPTKFH
jgi:hypothetical protein